MKNEIEDIFPRRLLPISHWQTFDVRLKSLFDNCEVGGDTDLDNWIWAGRKKRSSWTGDDDGQLSSKLSLLIQINSDIGQWKWVKEERFVIHWSQTKYKRAFTLIMCPTPLLNYTSITNVQMVSMERARISGAYGYVIMHSVRKQGVLGSRIDFLLSSMDFMTTGHSVHCYFHILEMEKYLQTR